MIRLDRLTEDECECFRSRCNFTEDERRAFDLRAKGKSRIEISSSLAVSVATVDRQLRGIRNKMQRVRELGS